MGGKKRKLRASSSDDDYTKSFDYKASPQHEEPEGEDEEVTEDHCISPVAMAKYIKDYIDYIEKNGKKNVSVKCMNKLTEDFLSGYSTTNPVDTETFNKCFRKFLHISLRQNNLSVSNSLRCIEEFLDRPEIVAKYPDFPARPPTVFALYIKKNNVKGPFSSMAKDVKEMLQQDNEGRSECERELADFETKFLEDLKEFANNHPELNEKQRTFLQNKINSLNKKINPTVRARTPGPTPRKPTKKPKSAYELFCSVESAKYESLSPEKREKKLLKKFNKLDDGQREIYAKVAFIS